MRFTDKCVVVLGGNAGIGLAAARMFRAEGAKLALTGRNADTLAAAAEQVEGLGIVSDMGDVAQTDDAMAEIADALGGIDVLFVNAGVGGFAPVDQVTEEFWDGIHQVNLRGAFEAWVDPGYIQHNPNAQTGRDAAIAFLEPFIAGHPGVRYDIKRVIADGNLVAVHSWGRFSEADRGVAVVDILRIEGCRVMEHWDVVQPVPETSANTNGMF